ncbi:AAA family ATPase [Sulfobacillus harzensis]|uniref:MoxR family ATPase n=1 Tax=Sulfobacillus harzensis TaxID=2729629 RepID=A0A7Y0L4K0_9FIRM|nr:MoxR family ATPase [Sulfobacillus harzensis]NMP23202.1 MoxR family ATPase [Sulfobacillus harzensis]
MQSSIHPLIAELLDALDKLVLGKRQQTSLIVAAWIAGGHVLLDDVPGVAKTRLARALARLTQLSFARVQGTPDLLPQDITGGVIYDLKSQELVFRPGPVFHHIVLVDEVNRTTPRTQAALLECMEERQVSADGVSHPLPNPFLVIATQNPVEMEGTFPLPEAELDRFLISLSLGYPTEHDVRQMVMTFSQSDALDTQEPALTETDLAAWREQAQAVTLNAASLDYLVGICRATREHPLVDLGASPRTTVRYAQMARAWAFVQGDSFVTPDHIKYLAPYILGHRLVPSASASVSRLRGASLVEKILEDVPVPVETP